MSAQDSYGRKIEPYPRETRRGFYAGALIGCLIILLIYLLR